MYTPRKCACYLLAMFVSCVAHAQVERGTISGTVRDPSGGIVPGASVTVKNVNTGVQVSPTTNQAGEYVAPNLIPGEYSVTVSHTGFESTTVASIILYVDERRAVDVELTVGAVTQNVQVEATAPLVQSESNSFRTIHGYALCVAYKMHHFRSPQVPFSPSSCSYSS